MNLPKSLILLFVVLLIIPFDGFFGDFRYETCEDYDASNSNHVVIEMYEEYYFVCKIGYIEGKVSLGWKIHNPYEINMTVSILNTENLHNFISGEPYGFSNSELAKLHVNWEDRNEDSLKINTDVNLIGDIYYLVINLGYRTTFGNEDVEQKSRLTAHSDWFSNTILEADKKYITCSIDLDYIEDW